MKDSSTGDWEWIQNFSQFHFAIEMLNRYTNITLDYWSNLNLHLKIWTLDRKCCFVCDVNFMHRCPVNTSKMCRKLSGENVTSYHPLRNVHSPQQIGHSLHHGSKGQWSGVSRGDLNLVMRRNKTWLCFYKLIARTKNVIGPWAATGALRPAQKMQWSVQASPLWEIES